MRYLKRIVVSTLIYTACYLVFIALLQALTGYDYTPAYSVGGIAGVAEAALCSIIKIFELKEVKKYGLDSDHKSNINGNFSINNSVSDTVAENENHSGTGGTAE